MGDNRDDCFGLRDTDELRPLEPSRRDVRPSLGVKLLLDSDEDIPFRELALLERVAGSPYPGGVKYN